MRFFFGRAGITVISHLSDLGERISRRDTARTDGPAKEILTEQAIGMKVPITFHQTNFYRHPCKYHKKGNFDVWE